MVYLKLTSLTVQDCAVYYCAGVNMWSSCTKTQQSGLNKGPEFKYRPAGGTRTSWTQCCFDPTMNWELIDLIWHYGIDPTTLIYLKGRHGEGPVYFSQTRIGWMFHQKLSWHEMIHDLQIWFQQSAVLCTWTTSGVKTLLCITEYYIMHRVIIHDFIIILYCVIGSYGSQWDRESPGSLQGVS